MSEAGFIIILLTVFSVLAALVATAALVAAAAARVAFANATLGVGECVALTSLFVLTALVATAASGCTLFELSNAAEREIALAALITYATALCAAARGALATADVELANANSSKYQKSSCK